MAKSRPSFDGMLRHLYASVLDPARFEDFAADLRVAMNAHLVALQTDDARHLHSVQRHYCDARITPPRPDYANDGSINLYFVRGAAAFESRGILDGTTLFEPGELERTAFYRDVLVPLEVQYSMGWCLAADQPGHLTALTVSRDRGRPPFGRQDNQLARRLLPHLQNVHALRQRFHDLESTTSVLDRMAYGIWLFDANGRVVRANRIADDLMAGERRGLAHRGSFLVATWHGDRPMLRVALANAGAACEARRSDFMLHDSRGRPWAACTMHPLHSATLDPLLPGTETTCMLLVHPFSAVTPASPLREVFGLTAAEAELAEGLLLHGSLQGCCKASAKSHETLRSQLKALFAKTETHRQAELIRRLAVARH